MDLERIRRGFATRLNDVMEERGYSQTELAERAELTQSSVHDLLHRALPSGQTLIALCRVLRVTADWLLLGRGSRAGGPASAGESYMDGGTAAIAEMRSALDGLEGTWRGTTSQAAAEALQHERVIEEREKKRKARARRRRA